jgi:hypothetical protein
MEPLIQDEKYVVFKRDDIISVTDGYVTFATDKVLEDAVVIRRQDKFASTALATYATTIAMVAQTTPDEVLAKRLLNVADYFQQQSEAAADQGYKFPD